MILGGFQDLPRIILSDDPGVFRKGTRVRTFLLSIHSSVMITFPWSCLLLLSDLPTPCFVIDLKRSSSAPSVILEGSNHQRLRLRPVPLLESEKNDKDSDISLDPDSILETKCLLHTQVIESSNDDVEGAHVGALAVLDLPDFVGDQDIHLVLGINNHLTISCKFLMFSVNVPARNFPLLIAPISLDYWARAAGAGAFMEAPGIEFRSNRLFASHQSTNDGKRSEWVHFLRPGDQVQLRTENLNLLKEVQTVYGVSRHGRPLGSEPQIICRYGVGDD